MVVALVGSEFKFFSKVKWRKNIAWVLWRLPTLLKVIQAVIPIADVVNFGIWEERILSSASINVDCFKEGPV